MNEIVSSVIAFAIGGIAYVALIVILKNKRKRRTTAEIIESLWAKINKQDQGGKGMIQKLEYETHKAENGIYYGAIPSDTEIIAKVNEVIDHINSLPEEKPSEDLEEAAEKFAHFYDHGTCDGIAQDCFISGAKWQKEQDQPITGNSLEQEWLRYVDRKKKECRGELPSLGEYGWLQIARHFANWQKEQMLKDAVEGEVIYDLGGFFRIKSEAIDGAKYKVGSWVKLIIVKED